MFVSMPNIPDGLKIFLCNYLDGLSSRSIHHDGIDLHFDYFHGIAEVTMKHSPIWDRSARVQMSLKVLPGIFEVIHLVPLWNT